MKRVAFLAAATAALLFTTGCERSAGFIHCWYPQASKDVVCIIAETTDAFSRKNPPVIGCFKELKETVAVIQALNLDVCAAHPTKAP